MKSMPTGTTLDSRQQIVLTSDSPASATTPSRLDAEMNRSKEPLLYPGPDGVTKYNVKDPKEMAAWEDAWADSMGQPRGGHGMDDVEDTNHDQHDAGPVDPVARQRRQEATEYVRTYAGTFGLVLDLKANLEKYGPKYFRITPRQIDAVLASKVRESQWAAERATAAQRPAQNVSGPVTQITKDGFYQRDGIIYKVQVAVHGSGNLYAKQLIIENGTGRWEYIPGAVMRLKEEHRLTLEQAQEFGRLYGVCGVCGATLTDEHSIADGIGPICKGRLG